MCMFRLPTEDYCPSYALLLVYVGVRGEGWI